MNWNAGRDRIASLSSLDRCNQLRVVKRWEESFLECLAGVTAEVPLVRQRGLNFSGGGVRFALERRTTMEQRRGGS